MMMRSDPVAGLWPKVAGAFGRDERACVLADEPGVDEAAPARWGSCWRSHWRLAVCGQDAGGWEVDGVQPR
jgi:hypothetical protein